MFPFSKDGKSKKEKKPSGYTGSACIVETTFENHSELQARVNPFA